MQRGLHYDPLGDAVTDAETAMKREMLEAVLEITAIELAVDIVLDCIPIVGWALACIQILIMVVEQALGMSVKRKVRGVTDQLKRDLAAYQAQTQAEVHALQVQAANAAYPAAQKLAISNQPIQSVSGLGLSWNQITKPAQVIVSNMLVRPVQAIGTTILGAGALVAKMTGHGGEAKILSHKEDVWNDRSQWAVNRVATTLESPEQMKQDIREGMRTVTGYNQVDVATSKANDIRQKAFAAMDAAKEEVIEGMNKPEYQAQLVNNLALAIRGDPNLLSQAQYYQTQTANFAQANGIPSAAVVNPAIPKPASPLPLLAGAAAILGLIFLRR